MNEYWIPKILENADENIELVVVGNKTDLFNERMISKEETQTFIDNNEYLKQNKRLSASKDSKYMDMNGKIINSINFFEVSATKPDDVDKVFKSLLTKIMENESLREKILMIN